MAKIDVSKAAEIITRNAVEPELARRIIEEMQMTVTPEATDEVKAHQKKQYVCLLSDPDGRTVGYDFVAWVIQIPEDQHPLTTAERVSAAAADFNTTKKGRLLPAKTVGEAVEIVPAKFFKEHGVWVKTKTPVLVVRTDNQLTKATQ